MADRQHARTCEPSIDRATPERGEGERRKATHRFRTPRVQRTKNRNFEVTDGADERFAYAVERLRLLRAEWEAAGRPFVASGSNGKEVEAPLHKVLRLQEVLVDRLAARARPGRVGRPPSAVPGIPPPLKRVK
jgi:hypothetical protein